MEESEARGAHWGIDQRGLWQVVLEMPEGSEQKFKSKVEKKTNDPVFGDSFTFENVKGKLCQLVATVYHKNFIASDSQVGLATVPRQDVYGAHGVEQTFALESRTGVTAGKQVGSITLKILAS